MRGPVVWLMLATTGVSATPSYADGDAVAGKTVFENQCASCHSTEPGKQGFGPSLAGVVGRMSGTLPAFTYTPAMVNAHLTWDAATLDAFLTSSTQKVQGTAMAVARPNETTRADVIAFSPRSGRRR